MNNQKSLMDTHSDALRIHALATGADLVFCNAPDSRAQKEATYALISSIVELSKSVADDIEAVADAAPERPQQVAPAEEKPQARPNLKVSVGQAYVDSLTVRGLVRALEQLVDEALGDNAMMPIGSAVISTVDALVELTERVSENLSTIDDQVTRVS